MCPRAISAFLWHGWLPGLLLYNFWFGKKIFGGVSKFPLREWSDNSRVEAWEL